MGRLGILELSFMAIERTSICKPRPELILSPALGGNKSALQAEIPRNSLGRVHELYEVVHLGRAIIGRV